jgi:hypothetical protein
MTFIYIISSIFLIVVIFGMVKAYKRTMIIKLLKDKLHKQGYDLIIEKERIIADSPGSDDMHLGIFLIRSKLDSLEKIIGVRYKRKNGTIELNYEI